MTRFSLACHSERVPVIICLRVQPSSEDAVKVCEGVCVCVCVCVCAPGCSVTHDNEARVLMKWGIKRGGMFAISQAVSPEREREVS